MKFFPRKLLTLAAFLAVHTSGVAAVTVFQGDLAGFEAVAGGLPVLDFESIAPATDLAGSTIGGISFVSLFGNSLDVVTAASTFTDAGFVGDPGDSDNRLVATSGGNVLSPGGSALVAGPAIGQEDSLRLDFATPVQDFGIDVLFQALDGFAFNTTFELRNSADELIASGGLNIPDAGDGSNPASAFSMGGAYFIGFHSDAADIAQVIFLDGDEDDTFPDANMGYDTVRVALVPEPGALALSLFGLVPLFGRARRSR